MSITHQALLKLGYSYRPINRLKKESFLQKYSILGGVYIKRHDTKYGAFEVAMIQASDPHIELPTVFVTDMPLALQGRLIPHISHEGYLCYVEQMEADWNPNNLVELYKTIDLQIKTTLDIAVNAMDNEIKGDVELDNEFVSYWSSTAELYSLSELRRHSTYTSVLARATGKEKLRSSEYITVEVDKTDHDLRTNQYLQSWLNQRGLELVRPESPSIKTHYVWVRPSRLSGVEWPPQNLKEVLSWLELVDFSARDHLVRCLSNSKAKRNIVVLDIEKQDPVSVYLEVDINSIECQFSSRKTQRKREANVFQKSDRNFI